jgi:hypothetical protein
LVRSNTGEERPVTETHTQLTMHPKVPALQVLHTMFDKGASIQQHLEGKLREFAGIAAQYVPAEDHGRYLTAVRLVLGDAADDVPDASVAAALSD